MTAGLRVLRESSMTVQIDQDYSNFALRQKGAFTVNEPIQGYSPGRRAAVTVPGTTGVLAYRAPGAANMVMAQYNSNGTTTYHFFASQPMTIEYWLFDYAQHGQLYDTAGAGMLVWRADGTLAFDSRMKYMRFVDLIMQNGPPSDRSYPSDVVPAVIQGSFAVTVTLEPLPQDPTEQTYLGMWSALGAYFDGRTLRFQGYSLATPIQTHPPASGVNSTHDQNIYTVVDVSGF